MEGNGYPSYLELLADNRQLREENRNLREQIRLLKLSGGSDCELPKESNAAGGVRCATGQATLSAEEKVSLFASFFKGREDVFARRWHSEKSGSAGYQPVCLNEWERTLCDKRKFKCAKCPNRKFKPLDRDALKAHLMDRDPNGRKVVGVYPILGDNTCNFLCADFDDKSCEHGYQADALAYVGICRQWGIPHAMERSRSGNGAHVWIFFDKPLQAAKARRLGGRILSAAMEREPRLSFKSYDRFFPSQDELPDGGFGNLVALPLQGGARMKGNSVFVDESFVACDDQWAYLLGVGKMSEADVDRILAEHAHVPDVGQLSTSSESRPWETPPAQAVAREDFPRGIAIVKANMLYVPLRGLSAKAVNHLKRIASFQNPRFFEMRNMRKPIFNVPRVISCADVLDDYLALPRGCEEAVATLLERMGVSLEIDDRTERGKPINARFAGMLRDDQREAVQCLATHDTGVLKATTGFGKTVVAIALMAERGVNTLVLVHNRTLLDQWMARLDEFLVVEGWAEMVPPCRGRKRRTSPFGTLDSRGDRLGGIVDVAMVQSCMKDGELKPFVRSYGMIIVDECHRVSAVGYESVLKRANAHYVHGLTATPVRRDGLQLVSLMQCGPIRYQAGAREQMGAQGFERLLVPRFTSYRSLSMDEPSYQKVNGELAVDERRNQFIIADVRKALEHGRTPIVLTCLISHAEALSALLAPFCPNVVTLVGTRPQREKVLAMERLAQMSPSESLVVVATIEYVGEGFDYPRMDTLFLALPISWKGRVEQGVGRLHREYPGKRDVRVYDYIDVHVPMCDKMYRKRQNGYAAAGYRAWTDATEERSQEDGRNIFNGRNYRDAFISDISKARRSVVISTPRPRLSGRSNIIERLGTLLARGVDVVAFTRPVPPGNDVLQDIGARTIAKEGLSICTAIVDRSTIWYGDIDFLGYNAGERHAIRMDNPAMAEGLLEVLMG